MKVSRLTLSPSRADRAWPVLLWLLAAVLVPTACFLWFMNKAMNNERFAVRQRLGEAYQGQLFLLQTVIDRWLIGRQAELERIGSQYSGAAAFAACLEADLADGVICLGEAGQAAYPAPPGQGAATPQGSIWGEARRLESAGDAKAAAVSYALAAKQASQPNEEALALQGQIRCLARAGDREGAIHLIESNLNTERLRDAIDAEGRLLAPNAQLLALELLKDPQRPEFRATVGLLKRRLTDYRDSALSSGQRRFLMRQIDSLFPAEGGFPTLAAEDLAARFQEANAPIIHGTALQPSPLPGVWQAAWANGRLLTLHRADHLQAQLRAQIDNQTLSSNVAVTVSPPGVESESAVASLPIGARLPGWRLGLTLKNSDLLDATARQQVAGYFWTGALVIAATVVFGLLAARFIGRQMAVARLKNDLVATVSHELKTPLASMRLLVDTLLEAPAFNPGTVREYLEMIARENSRLSRLIDNFLLFSRMERDKYAFSFRVIEPRSVVESAMSAMRERFQVADCRVETNVEPGLPAISADADALSTALINLLDNACKYSDGAKTVNLRAYARNGSVCLAVEDNGIGLTPREAKKIFRRFYQVDQRLSRRNSGCGLGLSIVEFIMKAHRGAVAVESQPGRGSTFTLEVPACQPGVALES